jgi:hypothetical protein
MKLKKLKMENFRKNENTTLEFKNKNTLLGSNGVGKTSIKEAILFALYGRDLSGSIKGLDGLIRNGQPALAVTAEFETYTIIRKKSLGKSLLFYVDGSQPSVQSQIAQRDLEAHILPTPEVFQAIFDIGFFMKQLSEKERRLVILSLTPKIDIKMLAHEEYDWLESVESKFPVFYDEYEVERDRFLRIRRQRQTDLDKLLAKIELTDQSADGTDDRIKELREKIAKLKATPNDSKICESCGQTICDPTWTLIANETRELTWELNRLVDTKEAGKANKRELAVQRLQLGKDVLDLTKVIDMLGPKGLPAIELDIKLKPILEYLQKEIKGLEIITLEEVKSTLEWRECFHIAVNGVIYEKLSTGEQMKVDIAISKLLDKLSGQVVNMFFVDHVESLTGKVPNLEGQTFLAQVSEDKNLKLTKEE